MLKITALEKLVHELTRLPGVGRKTAERLAYHILRSTSDYSEKLQSALVEVRETVHECPECFSYTDKELCSYCEDPKRENNSICVVEEPFDISQIEAAAAFRGRFHVLHGTISPLDGVSPEDLRISELISKIENRPEIREVILALDADLEGDTTVLYLTKLLKAKNVKVTRLAHGIPMGSDIDYIDGRTMRRALDYRVEV